MNTQNYKNHARIVFTWHGIVPIILLFIIISSVIQVVNAGRKDLWTAIILLAISAVLVFFYFFIRKFALTAQDRAIRAEENLRHFVLTGKPLDRALHLTQIIALRFASDAELPGLAKRAVTENLTSKQIKQAISIWKPDHHRV